MAWTGLVYPRGSVFKLVAEWREPGTAAEDPADFTYSEPPVPNGGGADFKRHALKAYAKWDADRTLDAARSATLTTALNNGA